MFCPLPQEEQLDVEAGLLQCSFHVIQLQGTGCASSVQTSPKREFHTVLSFKHQLPLSIIFVFLPLITSRNSFALLSSALPLHCPGHSQ